MLEVSATAILQPPSKIRERQARWYFAMRPEVVSDATAWDSTSLSSLPSTESMAWFVPSTTPLSLMSTQTTGRCSMPMELSEPGSPRDSRARSSERLTTSSSDD